MMYFECIANVLEFYTAIMKVHDSLSKNYDPAVGVEEPVVGVATPSRHLQKTKKAHRPHLPRKKDGSVSCYYENALGIHC